MDEDESPMERGFMLPTDIELAVELAKFIERRHHGTVDLIGHGPNEASYRITVDRLALGKAP